MNIILLIISIIFGVFLIFLLFLFGFELYLISEKQSKKREYNVVCSNISNVYYIIRKIGTLEHYYLRYNFNEFVGEIDAMFINLNNIIKQYTSLRLLYDFEESSDATYLLNLGLDSLRERIYRLWAEKNQEAYIQNIDKFNLTINTNIANIDKKIKEMDIETYRKIKKKKWL